MAPSVARWLELVMLGGDPWILPIWTAANEAARAGTVPPLTDELGQLGLHPVNLIDQNMEWKPPV